jgi:hypothetical protein
MLIDLGETSSIFRISSQHARTFPLCLTVTLQAEETRKKILAQAASEKLLVAGMHLDRSGFANVLKAGQGYRIAYRENGRECRCASRTGRQAKNAGHL